MIASFIAAGYMTDGKHGNPALDAAQQLAIDEIEAAQLDHAKNHQKALPKENSYEKIQQLFGGMVVLGDRESES
jgi:hypothetical protein